MRLELTRHNCHYPLKVARLPIPPFLQFRVIILLFSSCPEQDSNLHVSQHSHLKRARLPFRHLGKRWSKILSFRAENEARTRDPNLGKVMLYQLSYFRNSRNRLFVSRLRVQRYYLFLNLQAFSNKFSIKYFIVFPNSLLIRISVVFSRFIKFRFHRGIFVSELADGQFFGILIGQT